MGPLLSLSCMALPMLQKDLAELLGVSSKTVGRWMGGDVALTPRRLVTLATAVHAKDPALAARIAAVHGQTLEELGIGLAPPPPPQVTRDLEAERRLADSIVLAAADAADVSPRAMRPALAAAFRRAREAGLTIDAADALFADPPTGTKRG